MVSSPGIKDGQFTKTIYTMIKEARYEEAISWLRVGGTAVSDEGERARLSLLAFCCWHTGAYLEAARCYELLGAHSHYRLYRAQALYHAGLYEDSLLALAPLDSVPELRRDAARLRAALHYQRDNAPAAHAILAGDAYDTDDPDKDVNLGCLLYKKGKYEEALVKFTKGVKIIGFDPHLHYNIGVCQYRMKDWGGALKQTALVLERAMRDRPELGEGRMLGESRALAESAISEACNLRAAVEAARARWQQAAAALNALPPRPDHQLDALTLHNLALVSLDASPAEAFDKLHFLLQQESFPRETFANLLLMYCKFEYYDLAADLLAENAEFTYEYLTSYLYELIDAIITSQTSPEEAYQKLEELGSKQAERLRQLTRVVQEARAQPQGNSEPVRRALHDYEEALDRYIPVVMAQAKIYWDMEDYGKVEKIFRKSVEFCNESDVWRLNVAHVLFMQENKYKEAASFYEPIVRKHYDNILDVSAVVLANLCVSFIMTSQNEEAEELMRKIEKEEEQQSFEEPEKKFFHLCIVNLVIGTLYCAKGNYEFGVSRVLKALEPVERRLGVDTWLHAKRCFLALAEHVAKRLPPPQLAPMAELRACLESCEAAGARLPASPEADSAPLDPHHTIAAEARLINYLFCMLSAIDNSTTINKFEDLK